MSALVNPRSPPARPATLADLDALPETVTGEIIDGVLYAAPRPRPRHANTIGEISRGVGGPFQGGRGGPGGWWILVEPGIVLPRSPEVVPDLAGWRRERMPALPTGPLEVVPDWVCEVHSPSTRAHDVRVKRPLYARAGVRWLWYVDTEAHTLTVAELDERGRWVELGVYGEDDIVRAEPFDAVEIALAPWWAHGEPESAPPGAAPSR